MSGQFEQRRLARPAYQLGLLDAFIGEEQARRRSELRAAWRELAVARRRHEELEQGAAAAEARLAELRALVEDTKGLEPDTEESLRGERERLRHVTELAAAAAQAGDALSPDEGDGGADPAVAAAKALAAAEQRVDELVAALRQSREQAATPFAEAVAQELQGIGLGEGEFTVNLDSTDPGPTGADRASFLIRPNPGLTFAPVAETASGGELSRIAL